MSDWEIFTGNPKNKVDKTDLLEKCIPPWRDFKTDLPRKRGETYIASQNEIAVVNAAIRLRRPLLVTGDPGSGKSSLAYAIAEELNLTPVIKWAVNSRSTLVDALYNYDAIARLRDANLGLKRKGNKQDGSTDKKENADDIRRYINLQWLGTALASPRPRVLLIDEIDKADVDLPNDLLHVLEEGSFPIPELVRISKETPTVDILTCEHGAESVEVNGGIVPCRSFPIIVITSNGERELPPAFHRRCLRLDVKAPDKDRLLDMVRSHLDDLFEKDPENLSELEKSTKDRIHHLINAFHSRREKDKKVMANDQLLNMVYLLFSGDSKPTDDQVKLIQQIVFRGLEE